MSADQIKTEYRYDTLGRMVLNVEPNYVAAALAQYVNRAFRIFADWVKEGGVEDALEQLLPDVLQAAGGRTIRYFAPQEQFDQFNNYGLPTAARRLRMGNIVHGPNSDTTVGALTPLIRASSMMQPAFLCAPDAHWTINGLAQGYARMGPAIRGAAGD